MKCQIHKDQELVCLTCVMMERGSKGGQISAAKRGGKSIRTYPPHTFTQADILAIFTAHPESILTVADLVDLVPRVKKKRAIEESKPGGMIAVRLSRLYKAGELERVELGRYRLKKR